MARRDGSGWPTTRIIATYHLTSEATRIADRAQGLAIEQSVECPLDAIGDPWVRDAVLGRVARIDEIAEGRYAVRIALAAATAPAEPGQLLNMLFGNASIQPDVALVDVELPPSYLDAFGGPEARPRRHPRADRRAGAGR